MDVKSMVENALSGVFLSKNWARNPVLVTLDLTHKCNLRCSFCYYHGEERPFPNLSETNGATIPAEFLIKNLVERVTTKEYYITGGEPFLYPELEILLRFLKKKQKRVILSTNGTLLDEDWINKIIEENLIHVLQISLHGPEDLHNEITGVNGAFKKTIKNVSALRELKDRSRSSSPTIEIHCVINKKNIRSLSEIAGQAAKCGADSLIFGNLVYTLPEILESHRSFSRAHGLMEDFSISRLAMGSVGHDISAADIEYCLEGLKKIELKNQFPFQVCRWPAYNDEELVKHYFDSKWVYRRSCNYPWKILRVHPSGNIIPCLGVKMGNVVEQGADRIWNGKRFRSFRRILYRNGLFPACFRCCKLV